MGCCGCSLRATSIFAAIVSLLQGSAWIGLSIYGLQLYNCQVTPILAPSVNLDNGIIDMISSFISDVIYLEYFYNVDCSVPRPNISTTAALDISWSDVTQTVVSSTHTWMLVYTILSALWIASSILLLIVAVGNKKSKVTSALHYPWIAVMIAITIADVVATVTYFLDINKTMGLKALLEFMGVEGLPEGWIPAPTSSPEDVATTIPAIVMGVIFSRFFVLWFMNTILLVYVCLAAVDVAKVEGAKTGWQRVDSSKPNANRPISGEGTENIPKPWLFNPQENTDKRRTNNQPQPKHEPYVLPNPQQHYQNHQMPHVNQGFVSDEPQVRSSEVRRFTPAYYQQQNQNQLQQSQLQQNQQQQQKQNQLQQNQLQQNQQNQLQQNQLQQNQQQKQSQLQQNQDQLQQNQQQFQSDPNRNSKRTSRNNNGILRNESFDNRKSAPVELRSQLPWSYLNHRDDPVAKMQFYEEDEDKAMPHIPVPDYTLHFPKRPRDPVNSTLVKLTQPNRPSSGKY